MFRLPPLSPSRCFDEINKAAIPQEQEQEREQELELELEREREREQELEREQEQELEQEYIMSYCRFSTDDFQCDLYLYEDCNGGWTWHIAGNRAQIDVASLGPKPKWEQTDMFYRKWIERDQKLMSMLSDCPRVDIDHPLAGKSGNCDTLGELLDFLIQIKSEGIRFPDYVLDVVREEMESDNQQTKE